MQVEGVHDFASLSGSSSHAHPLGNPPTIGPELTLSRRLSCLLMYGMHRALASCVRGLAWLALRYWQNLASLHTSTERALTHAAAVLEPALLAALHRYPALRLVAATMAGAAAPLVGGAWWVRAVAGGAYAWVHDELVPVAMDLSQRLPLLHELLSRLVLQHE